MALFKTEQREGGNAKQYSCVFILLAITMYYCVTRIYFNLEEGELYSASTSLIVHQRCARSTINFILLKL